MNLKCDLQLLRGSMVYIFLYILYRVATICRDRKPVRDRYKQSWKSTNFRLFRRKGWNFGNYSLSACPGQPKIELARQVDFFSTFPKERLNYFVIPTPTICHINFLCAEFLYNRETQKIVKKLQEICFFFFYAQVKWNWSLTGLIQQQPLAEVDQISQAELALSSFEGLCLQIQMSCLKR